MVVLVTPNTRLVVLMLLILPSMCLSSALIAVKNERPFDGSGGDFYPSGRVVYFSS